MSEQTPGPSGPYDGYQAGTPGQPGSPYGAPSPYGAYGGQIVPEHPQATTVLVLGIVSLFFPLLGPVPWVMGGRARREIQESGGRLGGLQSVTIGWVLGIVMTIMTALMALMMLAMLLFIVGTFSLGS